jgi:hypothetical protein
MTAKATKKEEKVAGVRFTFEIPAEPEDVATLTEAVTRAVGSVLLTHSVGLHNFDVEDIDYKDK